jgi:TonB family protein
MVQTIWQVLTDIGIEAEYCKSAVDAVERVTTQLFQIVVTDWDDQPEATFLLKTARDLKAAYRPLTLAIVGEDLRLPEALQAGANSVLVKPIHAEQVRDTMSTACELLRTRQTPASTQAPSAIQPFEVAPESASMAAMAEAGNGSPVREIPLEEKPFRAGEFLQVPSGAPGAQFDTECEVQKSLDQAAVKVVDALVDLEPMASAVATEESVEEEKQPALTGWASLQERIGKSATPKLVEHAKDGELLPFSESASSTQKAQPALKNKRLEPKVLSGETREEAALFAYMDGEAKKEGTPVATPTVHAGRIFLLGLLATAAIMVAVPQTRKRLPVAYRKLARAGYEWLNPRPVAEPPAATQHETFSSDGDEYKFPGPGKITDSTTDASQIRVVPVVDPTAKAAKSSDTIGILGAEETVTTDQPQGGTDGRTAATANPPSDAALSGVRNVDVVGSASSRAYVTADPVQPKQLAPSAIEQNVPPAITQPRVATSDRALSPSNTTPIPTSLRSQIASMTPESSGAKPIEAAMSSIEPVVLPEVSAWGLLASSVEPSYPESCKSGGQKGSVMLQVLIGRDGTVQDAKFLQGSLAFARAAIDAVKQWRFKPYSLNGRPVSVQSTITLNFKPPA